VYVSSPSPNQNHLSSIALFNLYDSNSWRNSWTIDFSHSNQFLLQPNFHCHKFSHHSHTILTLASFWREFACTLGIYLLRYPDPTIYPLKTVSFSSIQVTIQYFSLKNIPSKPSPHTFLRSFHRLDSFDLLIHPSNTLQDHILIPKFLSINCFLLFLAATSTSQVGSCSNFLILKLSNHLST